jgi:penicillin-binding protein 1C
MEEFQLVVDDYQSGERKEDESPLFNAGAAWLTLQALTNVNRPKS